MAHGFALQPVCGKASRLNHLESDWCDPISEVDENGQEVVVLHSDVELS
jgi:hypothetical protein